MADMSGLDRAVTRQAERMMRQAVEGMRKELNANVPVGMPDMLGRPRTGPRLKDTYRQVGPFAVGDVFVAEVGYTAPQANYSNDLQPPHVIRSRGNYPLRFWWGNGPKGAGVYHFMYVNHPGNARSASLGWFDKTVTAQEWRDQLDRVG
jgi:hypothetical protein